ncbi:MAG: hypothetical protein QM784_39315 [Polyangiaceae bacterium]
MGTFDAIALGMTRAQSRNMRHFNRISLLAALLLSGCGGASLEDDAEALGGAAGNAGSGGASQGGLPGVGGATKTGGGAGLGEERMLVESLQPVDCPARVD